MTKHKIVSRDAWLEARKRLLDKEKAFMHQRDELSAERRALPWERVDKAYVFDTPEGKQTLADLFDGRSQLVIYHFMYGPNAGSKPCKSCSFWADNFERSVVHLTARDVTMLAVSRGPLAKLEAFKKRMGWTFKWVSSGGTDFNFDYNVSFPKDAEQNGGATYNYVPKTFAATEMPGISVFYKDADGAVFHTYSCYARGIDAMNATYQYLDLVPKGRDEAGLPDTMTWVRYHDAYGT